MLYEPHAVTGAVESVPIAVHLLRVHSEHYGVASPGANRVRRRLVWREVDVVAAHLQEAVL